MQLPSWVVTRSWPRTLLRGICKSHDPQIQCYLVKVHGCQASEKTSGKDFEEEIAKREACVRGKTTVVDEDLSTP